MDDHRLNPPSTYSSRVEKISWLWSEINYSILTQLRDLPKEIYTSLALEDFSASAVRHLLQFIGVSFQSSLVDDMEELGHQRPNRTKGRTISPFGEWSDADQATFWKIAGPMMHRLGYAE